MTESYPIVSVHYLIMYNILYSMFIQLQFITIAWLQAYIILYKLYREHIFVFF